MALWPYVESLKAQVQIALIQPTAGARLKLHASHGRARDDAVKLHVSRVRGMHGQLNS